MGSSGTDLSYLDNGRKPEALIGCCHCSHIGMESEFLSKDKKCFVCPKCGSGFGKGMVGRSARRTAYIEVTDPSKAPPDERLS